MPPTNVFTRSVPVLLFLILNVVCLEYKPRTIEFDTSKNLISEEQLYLDEYSQFEKDLASGQFNSQPVSHGRSKRFVIFNTRTEFDIGVLIGIPMTVFLPVLSNAFNGRRKRHVESEEIYEDHPVVQPHVDRVDSYFGLMDIPDRSCQLRAVCEFGSEPEKYYPISDLVLTRIRNPTLHSTANEDVPGLYQHSAEHNFYSGENRNDSSHDEDLKILKAKEEKISLFNLYNKAADQGQAYGFKSCSQKYSKKCKYSMDHLLNMPVLQYWGVLSSLLKFSLKDADLML